MQEKQGTDAPVRELKKPLSFKGIKSATMMAFMTWMAPEPIPWMAGKGVQAIVKVSNDSDVEPDSCETYSCRQ